MDTKNMTSCTASHGGFTSVRALCETAGRPAWTTPGACSRAADRSRRSLPRSGSTGTRCGSTCSGGSPRRVPTPTPIVGAAVAAVDGSQPMIERDPRAMAHARSWAQQRAAARERAGSLGPVRVDNPGEHDEILAPMTSAPSPTSSHSLVSEGHTIRSFSVAGCGRLGQ